MSMTEEEQNRFAEKLTMAMTTALQAARSVSDSIHYDHHQWLAAKIMREKEMLQLWKELRAHLAKWGMLGIASGLVYAIYLGVRVWLKNRGVEFL